MTNVAIQQSTLQHCLPSQRMRSTKTQFCNSFVSEHFASSFAIYFNIGGNVKYLVTCIVVHSTGSNQTLQNLSYFHLRQLLMSTAIASGILP